MRMTSPHQFSLRGNPLDCLSLPGLFAQAQLPAVSSGIAGLFGG